MKVVHTAMKIEGQGLDVRDPSITVYSNDFSNGALYSSPHRMVESGQHSRARLKIHTLSTLTVSRVV